MISIILSRIVIVVLGTLYPAYASYKAVKTKNVKEYVKWMMYWIVFAGFICVETFADILISWLPFYYEIKIVFVIWLMAPATKGSSIIYRKFIHPQLSKKEESIDAYISKVSEQGYSALLSLGTKGLSYAANIVVSTAIKGQSTLAGHLRNSYSLNDLTAEDAEQQQQQQTDAMDGEEEEDDEADNRQIQERYEREMQKASSSSSSSRDSDVKATTSPTVRRSASSRTQKSRDADLYPVKELEEIHGEMETRQRSSKKSAYTHKEAYHYGTLPRRAKHSRPTN